MAHMDRDENIKGAGVSRPLQGSLFLRSAQADWVETEDEGFLVKPLLTSGPKGERTCLMKLLPGCFADLHAHEELEQVLVLEGEFYDQEERYAAGDYIVRAPGALHTAGSESGATLLVVYSRVE